MISVEYWDPCPLFCINDVAPLEEGIAKMGFQLLTVFLLV